MKSFTAVLLSVLVAATAAQDTYSINPTTVLLSLRQYWCDNQQTQCPLICLQTSARSSETQSNDCTASTLTYACVCSNGLSPNLTQYSQTIPFYICQEWGNQCESNCGNDATCASSCRQDHPCGAQNPVLANQSLLTTTMSQGASKTAGNGRQTAYTGFAAGPSSAAASATGGSADNGAGSLRVPFALEHGRWLGSVLVMGGLFAGFALVL